MANKHGEEHPSNDLVWFKKNNDHPFNDVMYLAKLRTSSTAGTSQGEESKKAKVYEY